MKVRRKMWKRNQFNELLKYQTRKIHFQLMMADFKLEAFWKRKPQNSECSSLSLKAIKCFVMFEQFTTFHRKARWRACGFKNKAFEIYHPGSVLKDFHTNIISSLITWSNSITLHDRINIYCLKNQIISARACQLEQKFFLVRHQLCHFQMFVLFDKYFLPSVSHRI